MKTALTLCILTVLFILLAPVQAKAFAVNTGCWVPPSDNSAAPAPSNPAPDSTYYTTRYALNLRPAPNTYLPRIALAPQGARVRVLDTRDGVWYRVEYNGLTGYMYAAFLTPYIYIPFIPPDISILAPVELLDWYTASPLLERFAPLTIIDIRTGISWQVARFGGDCHADVEPITARDTAYMHRAFNYTWTWEPRPVLVIVNARTLAASINGMPHGIITNHNNNVNGHFCLHFFGSRSHGSDTIHPQHHAAVLEAFFTALTWQLEHNTN